jgi:hypothetical protein
MREKITDWVKKRLVQLCSLFKNKNDSNLFMNFFTYN